MKLHLGVKQGLLSNKSPFFSSQSAGEWIPSMINHLYWSVVSCNGNGKELVERFFSVIHHVCNRHTFTGNRYYYVCGHSQCDKKEARTKKWMKPGSPSHKASTQPTSKCSIHLKFGTFQRVYSLNKKRWFQVQNLQPEIIILTLHVNR